jgi:curved DNA-binding protein CbpA
MITIRPMNNRRNYYRILHVQPDAPTQVIRASYRTLMQRMKLHPDLGGDSATASLINEAWAVLRNDEARAQYDRQFVRANHAAERDAPRNTAQEPPEPPEPPGATAASGNQSSPQRCRFCDLSHAPITSLDSMDICRRCASPLYPVDKQSFSQDSQRAIDRLDRRHRLTFFTNGDTTRPIGGQTRDMSLHGMQFVTDQAPAVGAVIKLVTPLCQATARVVNTRRALPGGAQRWQVGVTFLTLRFESASGSFVSATA